MQNVDNFHWVIRSTKGLWSPGRLARSQSQLWGQMQQRRRSVRTEEESGEASAVGNRVQPVHCQVVVPDFPVKIYLHLIGECLKIVANRNRLTGFGEFREFMMEMCEELAGRIRCTNISGGAPTQWAIKLFCGADIGNLLHFWRKLRIRCKVRSHSQQ